MDVNGQPQNQTRIYRTNQEILRKPEFKNHKLWSNIAWQSCKYSETRTLNDKPAVEPDCIPTQNAYLDLP